MTTGDDHVPERLRQAGSLHLMHWVIVLASLALTIGAWQFSKEQVNKKLEERFTRESDQVIGIVKERMALYETALWGGVAFFDGVKEGSIDHNLWTAYANSLKIDRHYPGINGIGVIYNILPDDLEHYLARERILRPNYNIHPKHDRDEFWPITYIIPVATNHKAVGLDMAFEKTRYAGVLKARDTGLAQVTGPIVLVQDQKKTPGFLFYAPIYKGQKTPESLEERRKRIVGVVYAPFIMEKLMDGTLKRERRQFGLSISDGEDVLYQEGKHGHNPMFSRHVIVPMNGRDWQFNLWSDASFYTGGKSNQPSMILVGGIVIDCLLLGLFIMMTRSNKMAIGLADKMTAEVRAKAAVLEETMLEAESANRAKTEFLANMSHELRTPLNSIITLTDLCIAHGHDLAMDKHLEYGKIVNTSGHRLLGLINDILDISKIEAGKYAADLMEVDLSEIFHELGTRLMPLATEKSLSLRLICERRYQFTSSHKILIQILTNLINNAIKFTDEGEVLVSVNRHANTPSDSGISTHGPTFEISIVDTGIGIAQADLESIFNPFQQVDGSITRKYGGTGLGLNICAKLSALLGGSITVKSTLGNGSTFTLWLPETPPQNAGEVVQ